MKKDTVSSFYFLLFLVTTAVQFSAHLYQKASADFLQTAELDGASFRQMQLSDRMVIKLAELSEETTMPVSELLTVLFPFETGRFLDTHGFGAQDFVRWKEVLLRYNRTGFERVSDRYAEIWDDLECFPVAASGICYENSWMFERTYGGLRGHEGTDLMPPENIPGHYRIVSMTDGVVENIGWLPQGGWRIGIRSPSGGYFYYAHLDSYETSFEVGDMVKAGDVLGRMGDTGYGAEGTHGKFDVHLHLGIYVRGGDSGELSVNPYWILRFLQQSCAKTGSVDNNIG